SHLSESVPHARARPWFRGTRRRRSRRRGGVLLHVLLGHPSADPRPVHPGQVDLQLLAGHLSARRPPPRAPCTVRRAAPGRPPARRASPGVPLLPDPLFEVGTEEPVPAF